MSRSTSAAETFEFTGSRQSVSGTKPTLVRSGAILPIGLGMVAPTILAHGQPEVAADLLPKMYRADLVGCQLFSEPGAGSDLASLQMRAERDGEEWILNGQKVWTSGAHVSRYGMLLVRTDPDVPKHKGLSYFILDMESEGVEIRPLYQITGEAEFNEVYFTDARVPSSSMLGELGDGWRVAITTLMHERIVVELICEVIAVVFC